MFTMFSHKRLLVGILLPLLKRLKRKRTMRQACKLIIHLHSRKDGGHRELCAQWHRKNLERQRQYDDEGGKFECIEQYSDQGFSLLCENKIRELYSQHK